MIPDVEVVERYRGFDVCRTSSGHFVLVHPLESPEKRLRLVKVLAANDALDELCFVDVAAARKMADEWIAEGLDNG